MKEKTLNRIQMIVLCISIAFLFIISIAEANAQTSHVVDTVKYTYYDLKGRPVQPGFFAEKTMGWSMRFLADDGVRRREVWVSTIK